MSIPNLKLFYNIGRLPLKLHWGGLRVSWVENDHDRSWLKLEDGYHCKVCGKKLEGRIKLFCSYECEQHFEVNIRNIQDWGNFRMRVWKRDNESCVFCHKKVSDFVCDHIIPLFKGGRDWWFDPSMMNFQTLCIDCNKLKTARDMSGSYIPKAFEDVSLGECYWFKENYGLLDRYLKPILSMEAEK